MPKTVYIETTIPSHYFSRRTDPKSVTMREWTRVWWDTRRHRYDIVTSAAVFRELESGEHPDRLKKIDLLNGVDLLAESDEIGEIVKTYIANKLMPGNAEGDALHLAFASFFGCDYLLSWNCKHLANRNKESHMRIVNSRLGLETPQLLTPLGLLSIEEDV